MATLLREERGKSGGGGLLLPRLRQPPQGADRRPSAPLPVPRAPTLICRASPAKKTHGKHPFRCTAHAFAGDTSLPEKPGLVGPSAHPPHRSQNGKSSKDQRTTVGVRWAHGRASSQSRQHAHTRRCPSHGLLVEDAFTHVPKARYRS